MKLTFLGTRGNINIQSKEHFRHTSTLISVSNTRILIDAGLDWHKKLDEINADALFITHAHPDHVGGLKNGAPCPVYATLQTWNSIAKYPIADRRIITAQQPITIGALTVEAFEVIHSLNAPAVGYRICAGSKTIFYVPDVVKIKKEKQALNAIHAYCGDGAISARSLLVKKRNSAFIGHASIKTQLGWCKKNSVPLMIITHCGTEIVSQRHTDAQRKIDALAKKVGVMALIATDGMEFVV